MEKNNGENNFLHFPIPKMEKNNGEKVKTGNFLHYWNGEKEWGKNINNGEKLLMKMGKILSWIQRVKANLIRWNHAMMPQEY